MENYKMNKTSNTPKIIKTVLLTLIGIFMILPLVWMISASFKFESDVFTMPIKWIPTHPTLNNYRTAFTDYPYLRWYFNTFYSTIMVVILSLFTSSLAGYAFAKLECRGKDLIFMIFIGTMMIPSQIRIIPQFMMFRVLHLNNTLSCIILPWSYNAFAIFMMRQFFVSVPNELIEAAKIDGTTDATTFFRIVLPIASSQLAALGILAFTWGWNQYFGPLVYINDRNKQVLSVGIAMFKSTYTENYGIQMAGATLALLPIIIVYLALQKQFVESIALSGVKG
jgi:multiple sugar transport system permease protein